GAARPSSDTARTASSPAHGSQGRRHGGASRQAGDQAAGGGPHAGQEIGEAVTLRKTRLLIPTERDLNRQDAKCAKEDEIGKAAVPMHRAGATPTEIRRSRFIVPMRLSGTAALTQPAWRPWRLGG